MRRSLKKKGQEVNPNAKVYTELMIVFVLASLLFSK